MKTHARYLMFAATMAVAGSALAQGSPTPPPGTAPSSAQAADEPDMDPAFVFFGADYLAQEVGATAEQAEQLRAIETDINDRLRNIEQDAPDVRSPKVKALLQERGQRETKVLTKEQLAKVDQLRQEVVREHEAKHELGRRIRAQ
ncbi:MAG TPA: hypothetical protein PLV70_00595 [Flavobacteriales bacterium]|nr:hypothetical protein [Flavobacteriales bacterium]HRQ83591.1 hypothetical protein [Flavobacteriales bacterium]